jgi:O-antigen ligase
MLIRNPIGLLAESTKMAPIFGLGTDENNQVFRPFGLSYHPNNLANHHLIFIFIIFFLNTYLKKIPFFLKKTSFWAIIISIIVIILSLSRAAYFALLSAFILIYLKHPKLVKNYYKKITKKTQKIHTTYKVVLILSVTLLVLRISDRLITSIYAFGEFGGISTRTLQYQEAWEVFKKSPILGIGDNMFIPVSYQLFPQGVMTYFPENVHQGIFLFVIERGLLGVFLYIIFLYSFLKYLKEIPINKLSKTMIYSGSIALFIIMLFHPIKNLLNFLFLIIIALTHYEKKINQKT